MMNWGNEAAGSFSRDPLVFSRLARGGKKTILTTLFEALKSEGRLTMIISFNSIATEMQLLLLVITVWWRQKQKGRKKKIHMETPAHILRGERRRCVRGISRTNQRELVFNTSNLSILRIPTHKATDTGKATRKHELPLMNKRP